MLSYILRRLMVLIPTFLGVTLLTFSLIRRAVDEARGNVMEAARALGISRATVYRKLNKR